MSREAAKASTRRALLDSGRWQERFRRMATPGISTTRFGTEVDLQATGGLFAGSLHSASQESQAGVGDFGRTLKSEWILHCAEELNVGEEVRDERTTPSRTYRILSKLNHQDQAVRSYLVALIGGSA